MSLFQRNPNCGVVNKYCVTLMALDLLSTPKLYRTQQPLPLDFLPPLLSVLSELG